MAERSKLVLDYLQALCSLPSARRHPAFAALLETGKAAEASRQQLLRRVDALETELAKKTMAMSAMEAENRTLSLALKQAEDKLAQVCTPATWPAPSLESRRTATHSAAAIKRRHPESSRSLV
jgi:small-conductance mechanosensitive channel